MSAPNLALLIFFGILWGSNFIYMKLAAEYVSIAQIVLLRVGFGFVPVLLYCLLKKELSRAHIKHIGHFFIMAFIAALIYYYSFAKGTILLFSGVAGALSGAIPIFSFIIAVLFLPEEKAGWRRLLGAFIGFAGIVLIADPFAADLASTNIVGVLYMVVGALSLGGSFVYAKKFIIPLRIPPAALAVYQFGIALFLLLLFTDTEGIGNILTSPPVALATVVGLGILGTGIAHILYYYVINKLGAVSASSVGYITPVVALIIGAVLVGEDIVATDYLGTAFIFIGVMLVNKKETTAAAAADITEVVEAVEIAEVAEAALDSSAKPAAGNIGRD